MGAGSKLGVGIGVGVGSGVGVGAGGAGTAVLGGIATPLGKSIKIGAPLTSLTPGGWRRKAWPT